MKKPNAAQSMLAAMGVDHQLILLGHKKEKSRSHTKKGPGRIHQHGKRKED